MRRQNVALTVYLVTPAVLIAGLMWLVAESLRTETTRRIRPDSPVLPMPAQGTRYGQPDPGNRPRSPGTAPAAETAPADRGPPAGALVPPESLAQGFVLVVRDKSGRASADSPLFLASNHNNWNPGDPGMRLVGRSDGRWQIALPKPASPEPMQFKFTRGSWALVEVAADLSDIPNRTLPPIDPGSIQPGTPAVIEFEVEAFADQRTGAAPGADAGAGTGVTGTVRRLQVVGGGGGAARLARDVLVWLPPGYDEPANALRRYPVLYLMDGQNLYAKHAGVPDEWHADETATRLIEEGRIEPLIIVGVPDAGPMRAEEYVPPVPGISESVIEGRQPGGKAFVDWMLTAIMPRVERVFRVESGPEHTGIGGASLGGLIALYAGSRHPDTFGLVLAESPALAFRGSAVWKPLFEPVETWPNRVFIGIGGREWGDDAARSAEYAGAVRDFDAMLAERGLSEDRRRFVEDPDATHNEAAWAARLPRALEFLFPAR